MKKVDDLQEIVKIQNERFSLLEMQSKKTRNLALKDLQITIKHQSYRIAKWEAWIQDFETILATQENGSNKIIDPKPMSESNENNINAKRNLDRKSTFKYSFHYHIKVYGFYLLIHLMKKRYRREVSILDKIFIIGII